MLDKQSLNHTLHSNTNVKLTRNLTLDNLTINIELGCKSWLTGQYFYYFRTSDNPSGTLTFYILPGLIFSPNIFCAHPDKNLKILIERYSTYFPKKYQKSYPTLYKLFVTSHLDKTIPSMVESNIVLETSFKPTSNSHTIPQYVQQQALSFISFLNAAIGEADRFIQDNPHKEKMMDANQLKKIHFISEENLDLPLKATAGKIEFSYTRILNSVNYTKNFFICQVPQKNNKFFTFIIAKNFASECRLRAILPKTVDSVREITDFDFRYEVGQRYPNLYKVLVPPDSSKAFYDGPHEYKLKINECHLSESGFDIPKEVLKKIPPFLSGLITAHIEATGLINTPFFRKARKRHIQIQKAKDKAASGALLVAVAKLIINVGDFDIDFGGGENASDSLSFDGDTDFNIEADTDAISNIDTDIADPTTGTSTSDIAASPQGSPIQSFPNITGKHYLVSNPFMPPGLDAENMHSLGLIDDNTYNFACHLDDLADQRAARHQELMDMISNDDTRSVDQLNQDKYDLADSQQQEALRARDEAIAKGDMDEIGRQTDRVRDLQYRKETVKTTANYVTDIDVRAGLKKP